MDEFGESKTDLDFPNLAERLIDTTDGLSYLPNLLDNRLDQYGEKGIAKIEKKPQKKSKSLKGYSRTVGAGAALALAGLATLLVDPVAKIVDWNFSLRDGSIMSTLWRKPPVKLFVKLHIFNVTNAERFMNGTDYKLHYEELGPYVYGDELTNGNVTWADGTVSFTPYHRMKFIRELSAGDPHEDKIIVPNIALVGVASMLSGKIGALSLGLGTLVTYLDARPMLELSVHDYVWGYDDPLVDVARRVFPNWIDFNRIGLFDRMLDEGINTVTLSTRREDAFKMKLFNGQTHIKSWRYRPDPDGGTCGMANGSYEGVIYSRNLQPGRNLSVYRRMFCRPINFNYVDDKSYYKGLNVYSYKMAKDSFSSVGDKSCYCLSPKAGCFPKGIADLSPCYYRIPVGLSLPHYMGVDPKTYERIEGMKPDPEKHGSRLEIMPDLGVPLRAHIGIQLSVVVRKTQWISRVKPFDDMVLPVFWMKAEMSDLPDWVTWLLWLASVGGPIAQFWLAWTALFVGLLLVAAANIRYALYHWPRPSPGVISHRLKQDSRRYSALLVAALPQHELARVR